LREQLKTSAAPPPPPTPATMQEMQATLLPRLEGPLKELWPTAEIPLLNYELGFTHDNILVRIHYQSAKPLEKASEEMIANLLRTRLGVANLQLFLENEKPKPPGKKPTRNKNSRAGSHS